jgi:hypothetical protein
MPRPKRRWAAVDEPLNRAPLVPSIRHSLGPDVLHLTMAPKCEAAGAVIVSKL